MWSGLTINPARRNRGVFSTVPAAGKQAGLAYETTPFPSTLHRFSTAFEFNVTTNPDDPTTALFLLQTEGSTRWVLESRFGLVGVTPASRLSGDGARPLIGVVTDESDPLPGYPTLPPGATTFTKACSKPGRICLD